MKAGAVHSYHQQLKFMYKHARMTRTHTSFNSTETCWIRSSPEVHTEEKAQWFGGKKEMAPSQLGNLGLEGFSRTLSQLT